MQRLLAPFLYVALSATISIFFLFGIPVHAQTLDAGGAVDPLTIDISPEYPAPYQNITLSPSSSVFDISGATLSVTVNGTPLYKGSGGQDIPVTVGGPGTATNISITATSGGQSYTKQLTIRPASVALVVEPVSTTHAFYAGRGLVTSEGQLRIVAIPDLRTSASRALDPSTLEYTWKLGDQILESDSGIGKSVLVATAPERYRDADMTLTVQSPDGSIIAEAETIISPVDPLVRIYENDPLMGPLFDTALSGSITMPDAEDTYRGVGYYFSEAPSLSWTVNGVQNGTDQDITVRATGNGQGTAALGFSADQSDTELSANQLLSVVFGQKGSTGIFGL